MKEIISELHDKTELMEKLALLGNVKQTTVYSHWISRDKMPKKYNKPAKMIIKSLIDKQNKRINSIIND